MRFRDSLVCFSFFIEEAQSKRAGVVDRWRYFLDGRIDAICCSFYEFLE